MLACLLSECLDGCLHVQMYDVCMSVSVCMCPGESLRGGASSRRKIGCLATLNPNLDSVR